jgi:TonB family protein
MRRAVLLSALSLALLWAFFVILLPEVALPRWAAGIRHFFVPNNVLAFWPLTLCACAVLLALLPLLIAYLRSWPIVRRAVPLDDATWVTLLRDLSKQVGLLRPPALLIHPEPLLPMTVGFLHPRIVLPCDCLSWTASHRQIVLLYELSHVVPRDLTAQRFGSLIAACWWFRPLPWRTFRLLRRQNGQYVLRVRKPCPGVFLQESAGKSSSPGREDAAPRQVRVDRKAERLKLTREVPAVYPDAAKAAGIQGTVSFEMVISRDGEPLDIRLLSSPDACLTESALEAVRQWRYEPTLLNGAAVEIVTDVNVSYTLAH